MSYNICNNCVMDTSDPSIDFHENGQCSHCNSFYAKTLPTWQKLLSNKEALNRLKEDIRDRSHPKSDYDCLIGLSGGIDSSYLLHLAVNELNLRPLIFHVDAGWNSNIATSNIEN